MFYSNSFALTFVLDDQALGKYISDTETSKYSKNTKPKRMRILQAMGFTLIFSH